MKITVLEPLGVEKEKLEEIARPLIEKGHTLEIFEEKSTDIEELKRRVKDTNILVIANSPLKGEVIKAASDLEMISVAFTGVDHVDLDIAKENDILVSNAAGYSTPAVVELTFGLMIGILRNVVPLHKVTREGGTMEGFRQRELHGRTLGILGTGDIGGDVAKVAIAFGMKVIAFNRSENEELKNLGVEYMSMEDVFKTSDIVTIHLPLNDKTRGIVDQRYLNMLKKDAILINAARGPIIDNNALAKALNEEKISGSGIDVFDMEPPIPSDYPLLNAKNTVLTPHIAYASEEAMVRRAGIVFKNIEKFLEGNPQNVII
ncbi:NAD(P)-dependent oxidoreductase [Tissierella creatinophila]|uniref:Hydroxypyruvate reductase n=1 Tax=Tissierella creatinophila DSM 6911 TaxID=1123403 RepID=A0A1U7M710_TISCR|nr:NAD(P)-dependent oxidoreductase [Tissierella creatinophila]OLS03040.1 hydroxypyruvate reductase [Tissierella creatinophila DSM 6911]